MGGDLASNLHTCCISCTFTRKTGATGPTSTQIVLRAPGGGGGGSNHDSHKVGQGRVISRIGCNNAFSGVSKASHIIHLF